MDGLTDGAILICHPKFLQGHKKFLGGGGGGGGAGGEGGGQMDGQSNRPKPIRPFNFFEVGGITMH